MMRKHIFATLGTLLLLAAYQYPQSIGFLGLFFFGFYYISIYSQREGANMRYLYTYIFIVYLFSTSWILSTYPLEWLHISHPFCAGLLVVGMWLAFACSISIFVYFIVTTTYKLLLSGLSLLGSLVIIPSVWVVAEWVRSFVIVVIFYGSESLFGPHHTYFSFSYLAANLPYFNILFSITGMWGVVYIFAIVNILPILILQKKITYRFLLAALVCFGLFGVYAYTYYKNTTPSNVLPVMFVSTSFPYSSDPEAQKHKENKVLNELSMITASDTIIALPENIHIQERIIPYNNNLYIGSFQGEKYYNLFFKYDESITLMQKRLLMPVGEYQTYISKLLSKRNVPERFFSHRGNSFKPIAWNEISIGGAVCSENISPYIFSQQTRVGAEFFITVNSLSVFHGSSLLDRQTIALNQVRALENARDIVVVSNMAPSYIISARGELKNYVYEPNHEVEVVYSTVSRHTFKTPYVLIGDYVVYFSLITLLVYVFYFDNKRKMSATDKVSTNL